MKSADPRELAFRVLQCRERESEYIEDLLTRELDGQTLAPADRGLVQELTYGLVRWQAPLDWLIARKTQGRTQNAALQILLRLGLYQLFWLERIPDHAAVHQSVELAKRLGHGHKSGFVNAVLRGYLRERVPTERLLEDLKAQNPALGYSHPEWLWARWEKRWGREAAVRLMDWNNQPAGTFARVNTLRIQPPELTEQWKTAGVNFEPVQRPWITDTLIFQLHSHPRLTEMPTFQKGLFYVQDPSTLLAPQTLQPRPGERVLDLCAAPGGKTTYLAQLMADQGTIVAEDLHPDRLRLITDNCARLGITSVQVRLAANVLSDAERGQFDRVLLDAPCSNSGVMRRRVDLRWRIRPEEIERLRATQLELLRRAAVQLKPGGTLVYSTCSLEPEENQEVLETFVHEARQFRVESQTELLPFKDEVDGAFVARLVRVS